MSTTKANEEATAEGVRNQLDRDLGECFDQVLPDILDPGLLSDPKHVKTARLSFYWGAAIFRAIVNATLECRGLDAVPAEMERLRKQYWLVLAKKEPATTEAT